MTTVKKTFCCHECNTTFEREVLAIALTAVCPKCQPLRPDPRRLSVNLPCCNFNSR